ncbi:MAG: hypothetical protein HYU57_07515 [Micavibrio aeruginosavorus]|nr:hypothetical protein [Micavibrio aeruginosavorus]
MSAKPDIVMVGAGPVNLWTAIQIKNRNPHLNIRLYERYREYQRSHVLRVEQASLLLYGKKNGTPREDSFYKDVTGKTLSQIYKMAATGAVFIRTNDLEQAEKTYATDLGIEIVYEKIADPYALMLAHPEARYFIAGDGARSLMREQLLGADSIRNFPQQYIVEAKYQAHGHAGELGFLQDHYKANKILSNMAFEYVGRERNGTTPVTLRFFVDRETYDALPEMGFKDPFPLSDPRIPEALAQDIKTYMNVRKEKAHENFCESSDRLGKLTLSCYAAKKFGIATPDRPWFLVGDAAMGVPYFRSLNAGMIIGSQLAFILTRDISDKNKVRAYNACRPLDIAWEFTSARTKNMGLKLYDAFRGVSAEVPWEVVRWDRETVRRFQTMQHPAFELKNKTRP